MKFTKTNIENLIIIEPTVYEDNRGYFLESYNRDIFNRVIGKLSFSYDNESKSSKGVLRGLHFQNPPFSQAKLVRCTQGKVLDVVVDLRKESKTYGQHFTLELSGENKKQLFIPVGFAHGFLVLSESAIFTYKVNNIYSAKHDTGIRWNDPMLNIHWGVQENEVLVSEKDSKLPFFSKFETPFVN